MVRGCFSSLERSLSSPISMCCACSGRQQLTLDGYRNNKTESELTSEGTDNLTGLDHADYRHAGSFNCLTPALFAIHEGEYSHNGSLFGANGFDCT